MDFTRSATNQLPLPSREHPAHAPHGGADPSDRSQMSRLSGRHVAIHRPDRTRPHSSRGWSAVDEHVLTFPPDDFTIRRHFALSDSRARSVSIHCFGVLFAPAVNTTHASRSLLVPSQATVGAAVPATPPCHRTDQTAWIRVGFLQVRSSEVLRRGRASELVSAQRAGALPINPNDFSGRTELAPGRLEIRLCVIRTKQVADVAA